LEISKKFDSKNDRNAYLARIKNPVDEKNSTCCKSTQSRWTTTKRVYNIVIIRGIPIMAITKSSDGSDEKSSDD